MGNSITNIEDPRVRRKKLDPRVEMLVTILRTFPGLETVSSCGGHKHKGNRLNPMPEGEFYVDFICWNYSSDTTIPLIQKAIIPYADKVTISRDLEAEEIIKEQLREGDTAWEIVGKGVLPDVIAFGIYKEYKRS